MPSMAQRQQQGHPRTRNPLQPPAAFPDSGCHTTGLRCRSWLNHDPNSFRPIPQAPSTACSAACGQQQGHPQTRNSLQPPAAFPDSGCHATGLRCRSWLNHDPNSFRPIPQAPSTACSAACDVRSCAVSTITPASPSSTENTGYRHGLRWSPPASQPTCSPMR